MATEWCPALTTNVKFFGSGDDSAQRTDALQQSYYLHGTGSIQKIQWLESNFTWVHGHTLIRSPFGLRVYEICAALCSNCVAKYNAAY